MTDLERLDPWAELLAARLRQIVIATVELLDERYVRRDELPGEMDELVEVAQERAFAQLRLILDEQAEPAAAA
jgi:hypothetical protein